MSESRFEQTWRSGIALLIMFCLFVIAVVGALWTVAKTVWQCAKEGIIG